MLNQFILKDRPNRIQLKFSAYGKYSVFRGEETLDFVGQASRSMDPARRKSASTIDPDGARATIPRNWWTPAGSTGGW